MAGESEATNMAAQNEGTPVKTVIKSVPISALPELVDSESAPLSSTLADDSTKMLLQTQQGVRSMKVSGLQTMFAAAGDGSSGGSLDGGTTYVSDSGIDVYSPDTYIRSSFMTVGEVTAVNVTADIDVPKMTWPQFEEAANDDGIPYRDNDTSLCRVQTDEYRASKDCSLNLHVEFGSVNNTVVNSSVFNACRIQMLGAERDGTPAKWVTICRRPLACGAANSAGVWALDFHVKVYANTRLRVVFDFEYTPANKDIAKASGYFRVFLTEASQKEPFFDNSGVYTLTIPTGEFNSNTWTAPTDGVIYSAHGAFSISHTYTDTAFGALDNGAAPKVWYFDPASKPDASSSVSSDWQVAALPSKEQYCKTNAAKYSWDYYPFYVKKGWMIRLVSPRKATNNSRTAYASNTLLIGFASDDDRQFGYQPEGLPALSDVYSDLSPGRSPGGIWNDATIATFDLPSYTLTPQTAYTKIESGTERFSNTVGTLQYFGIDIKQDSIQPLVRHVYKGPGSSRVSGDVVNGIGADSGEAMYSYMYDSFLSARPSTSWGTLSTYVEDKADSIFFASAAAWRPSGTSTTRTAGHVQNLKSVDFGRDIKRVRDYAFCNCSSLTGVSFERVDPGSFEECANVGLFARCTKLPVAALPPGSVRIGKHCFDACSSLTAIANIGGVKEIDAFAFSYCSSLTGLTADSLTSIWPDSNNGKTDMTGVAVAADEYLLATNSTKKSGNDSLTKLPYQPGAFFGCISLGSLTLKWPADRYQQNKDAIDSGQMPLFQFGWYNFCDCNSLKEVHVRDVPKTFYDDVCYSSVKIAFSKMFGQLTTTQAVPLTSDPGVKVFTPSLTQANLVTALQGFRLKLSFVNGSINPPVQDTVFDG